MHIACSDTEKFPLIERLAAHVKTSYDSRDLTLIDGVRVRTRDGWWLVRASNTEAALVVRAEGSNPDALDRLVKNIESALAVVGMDWRA
jgi:phosphomannomutase